MDTIKTNIVLALIILLFSACSNNPEPMEAEDTNDEAIQTLKMEDLLRETLELTEGVEVILSYVEIPKATILPFHYHPGEEFAYLLEGSGILMLEDNTKINMKAGEAGKVPLKQAHSFTTLSDGAKLVVFRVHEKGQPDRILVE